MAAGKLREAAEKVHLLRTLLKFLDIFIKGFNNLFGDATARTLIFFGLPCWIGIYCINQSLN